jgi:hypothetical protein
MDVMTGGLWPILLKNSLDKPLTYRRQAIFFGFSLEVWQAS